MANALPPGPSAPRLMQGLRFAVRPVELFEDCARRYGEAFTLRLPVGVPSVFLSAPAAVREVFTGEDEALRGGEANGFLRPLLGANSILCLDGARHERERRLMMPPFHGERMLAYGRTMQAVSEGVMATWPTGRPFPIHREMQLVTLDVILRSVFGLEQAPATARLRELLRQTVGLGGSVFLLWPRLQVDLGPWSPWGRLVRIRREIDALLRAEFARRRAVAEPHDDILSLLIAARDEQGNPLSDEELRDEMLTLLVAGHETTATGLAWTIHRVLAHDDVRARLLDELRGVGGGGPVAPDQIGRLEYLDAVIKETLRLNPVIPDVGRLLAHPARIGGWDLPAGVAVVPCIYLTHRRPDVWPDPLRFEPERFIGRRPTPYEFFPFGGGVRRCLGMAFALYEMKVVLATILSHLELHAAPGYRMKLVRRSITFAPSEGMPVVVERRAA